MTDYKILQNIDLAQNEIKEVSKIANDRQDGKDKGILIQTGDNTSLTFKRKLDKENFIEGKVLDGTGEEVKKSILNIKPSEVFISNEKGNTNPTQSKIELNASKNSALIESKAINIFSKDSSSGKSDTINISGSTVNITDATTNIKTDTLNLIKSNSDTVILTLNTETPKVTIPSGTETDINSQTIGLGDSDSNTTVLVSGSEFNVETSTTSIKNTTTVSGTTTLRSEDSSSAKNTLVVNEDSTSITGTKADINPTTVNIGATTTATTTAINVGRNNGDTTTLQSNITNITSPTLEVKSDDINFNGINQTVTFEGTGNSSLISKVPTDIENTTFSVKRGDSTDTEVEVFKVDTSKASPLTTTIKGTKVDINPTTVNIGTDTTGATNHIYIGKNSGDTTILKSNTTNIISPMIGIGTEPSSDYPLSIGKNNSFISLLGNNDLSITADNTNSEVQATDLKFTSSLSSNNIKIYWDSKLQSLVFARG